MVQRRRGFDGAAHNPDTAGLQTAPDRGYALTQMVLVKVAQIENVHGPDHIARFDQSIKNGMPFDLKRRVGTLQHHRGRVKHGNFAKDKRWLSYLVTFSEFECRDVEQTLLSQSRQAGYSESL